MTWQDVVPETWAVGPQGVEVGGVPLVAVAEGVGTPCYVVDRRHLSERLARFERAFGDVGLAYAAKAFWCVSLAELIAGTGWLVDVVSEGERAVAAAGGIGPQRQVVHGNVKTDRELEAAIADGVYRLVVDGPDEMRRLVAVAAGRPVDVLLRLNVDVAADTHPKIRTTGAAAQFGMTVEQADDALAQVVDGVTVRGVHVHIGSQLRQPRLHAEALTAIGHFVEARRQRFSEVYDLDVGGGFPVAYLRSDVVPPIEQFADAILGACSEFPTARLIVEPGRSVVANAGVSIYTVVSRKEANPPFLAVDGGLSDNPRPSMYGAGYEMVLANAPTDPHDSPFRVVGRHCETGDQLGEALLPSRAAAGDLLVMAATGAYGFSMSSRYNLLPRRPVVFVADGAFEVAVPGETLDDLVR